MKMLCRRALWSIVSAVTLIGASRADTVLVDATAAYPEGPLWRDGKLLYVEYAGPGIKIWDGKRVLDETGKQIRAIDKDSAGKPFIGPNDFTADGAGGIYVTASGVYDLKAPISGTILYLSPAKGTLVEVANLIHYSNGLALSKDSKSLLVAEMLAGRILSFPVRADGTLGPRTVWARMQDLAPPTPHEGAYNGPDGFKLGPDGNYYIAQNGSGRVLVVNDQKKLVRMITVPTPYVTNVNFGANGADTVYITGVFDPWKAPFPGAVYRWTK